MNGRNPPAERLFHVKMTPEQFLLLVPELDYHEPLDHIDQISSAGEAFALPLLQVDFDPDYGLESYPRVVAHDGRHRMTRLVADGVGSLEIWIAVEPLGDVQRVDDETVVAFRSACWSQEDADCGRAVLVKGPLFGAAAVNGRALSAGEVDCLFEIWPGMAP